jgi:hypothetical protein
MERIPVGTVIGARGARGWSHLVLFATPTLTQADLEDAPALATHYAQMFKFTLLANVVKGTRGGKDYYCLQRVARGFATNVRGAETIIAGNNTLGADLGVFGPRILAENEKILDNDLLQVARTETMMVFDGQAVMRRGNDHVKMVIRHVVLVLPGTGELQALVWLLATDGRNYWPAERDLQLLPPGMREARLLSVKRDKFTLGIPSREAFALMRIPQGKAIPYTADLQKLATTRALSREQMVQLERALRNAVLRATGR